MSQRRKKRRWAVKFPPSRFEMDPDDCAGLEPAETLGTSWGARLVQAAGIDGQTLEAVSQHGGEIKPSEESKVGLAYTC